MVGHAITDSYWYCLFQLVFFCFSYIDIDCFCIECWCKFFSNWKTHNAKHRLELKIYRIICVDNFRLFVLFGREHQINENNVHLIEIHFDDFIHYSSVIFHFVYTCKPIICRANLMKNVRVCKCVRVFYYLFQLSYLILSNLST